MAEVACRIVALARFHSIWISPADNCVFRPSPPTASARGIVPWGMLCRHQTAEASSSTAAATLVATPTLRRGRAGTEVLIGASMTAGGDNRSEACSQMPPLRRYDTDT